MNIVWVELKWENIAFFALFILFVLNLDTQNTNVLISIFNKTNDKSLGLLTMAKKFGISEY